MLDSCLVAKCAVNKWGVYQWKDKVNFTANSYQDEFLSPIVQPYMLRGFNKNTLDFMWTRLYRLS